MGAHLLAVVSREVRFGLSAGLQRDESNQKVHGGVWPTNGQGPSRSGSARRSGRRTCLGVCETGEGRKRSSRILGVSHGQGVALVALQRQWSGHLFKTMTLVFIKGSSSRVNDPASFVFSDVSNSDCF